MAPLTNAEVITAAGASSYALLKADERWGHWSAEFRIIATTYRQNLIILNADCRWQDVDNLARYLGSASVSDPTIIVRGGNRAPISDLKRVKTRLGISSVIRLREFLYDSVYRALSPRDFSAEAEDLFFVQPDVHVATRPAAEPALVALEAWLKGEATGDADDGHNIAVLLAPAGVGKTTLSERLFTRILSTKANGIIPLLLAREQWAGIASRPNIGLTEIWAAGISEWYPQSMLGPAQLDIGITAGSVRPIFDGLDELCSVFPADFNVTEVVESLIELADEGRILVTSRTRFWEEQVDPVTRSKVLKIELHPFSQSQRDAYLGKRFPEEPQKRDYAKKILSRIAGATATAARTNSSDADDELVKRLTRLDAVPYVVMLAAESADSKDYSETEKFGYLLSSADFLEGLFLGFCERERQRQSLSLDAPTQLRMLEILALEFGARFDSETLELAIAEVAANVSPAEVARLRDHLMLRQARDAGEKFEFRYDFVPEYLTARVAARWATNENIGPHAMSALSSMAEGSDGLLDRATELVLGKGTAWAGRLGERLRGLTPGSIERSGATHLLLSLIRRTAVDHSDASRILASATGLSTAVLEDLRVRGPIQGFDFRKYGFRRCVFVDSEWSNCYFSEETEFQGCYFDGRLSVSNCPGFGQATFDDQCTVSPLALPVLQREQNDDSKFPVTEVQIVDALRGILRAFSSGNIAFNPLNVSKVETNIRKYPFGERLLRALLEAGVVARTRVNSRGDTNRFEIQQPNQVRQFLNNAARVGSIRTAFEDLKTQLITQRRSQ
jgi:hypothetical protein